MQPLVRVEEAALGPEAQVRLVVSGVDDPDRLRSAWASSGASLERRGDRIHATTTVQALARAAGRALDAAQARALEASLRSAVTAWGGPTPDLLVARGRLALSRRVAVMGILNVTPDSFSDGGRLYPDAHPDRAVDAADALVAAGADVLDVGGESTRPGAEPVGLDEELRRVEPVLDALRERDVVCSIDTRKAEVARAALRAGVGIVNDVGAASDPDLLAAVAEAEAGYVLVHTRGTPLDMQERAHYDDVVAEVYEFLAEGLRRCVDAGIALERIAVDPGLGFAKTAEHNLALLRALRQFRGLGRPVVVGASRKGFLGHLLEGAPTGERLEGSLACAALSIAAGAAIVRVHDVAPTVRTARVARAVATGRDDWPAST